MKVTQSRNKREGRYLGKIGGWMPGLDSSHQRAGPSFDVQCSIHDAMEHHRSRFMQLSPELIGEYSPGTHAGGLIHVFLPAAS